MILERKIYSRLLDWKLNSAGTKALLVEGARRIGKSTIIEHFAKNEYDSYLIVDFSDVSKSVLNCFENNLGDLDAFFMILSAEYHVELHSRKSLVVFDEVQRHPKARQAIKKLVKDGRYDYIETGSLISIKDSVKDIVIPSEERSIKMYPLDFEEFAWALGEKELVSYIRKCFADKIPLDKSLHNKAMLLFKQYLLVGGMPQSIVAFVEKERKFSYADVEKRDILSLYRNDIMKIAAKYRAKVLSIFDQIPSFLSQHEKRVVFGDVAEGSYFSQYADTFFWLGDSMIVNECFSCSDPNVGLSLNENRTSVKCYMGDTGLLVSHTFDENEIVEEDLYRQILNDKLSLNEGMLFENFVAQTLVANGHKLYFFVQYNAEKHRNDIEIDFIVSNASKTKFKIFPIEVKSTKKYSTISLERFVDKYHQRIGTAYVIHPKNLVVKDNGVVCIPPYMAICL